VSIKTRALPGNALPLWFAMTSPLIGVLAGLLMAWILGRS